ncbi:MAG: nucleoside monophosphate kinase [Bacilli bacterium]|nr:nucleoside monophosphate kinase [Bacilli bacterium]
MINVILIAPPFAGKGTISEYLVKTLGYSHISTGDLLRNEINKNSEIGKAVKNIMSQGKFVSDDIIFTVLEEELSDNKESLIFDGNPRNIKQAEMLLNLFKKKDITNYCVITLDIKKEDLLKRVMGRRICPKCGRTYNLNYKEMLPLDGNLCIDCKMPLIIRDDDNINTFNTRYQTYLDNTYPVIEYFQMNDVTVFEIDASNDLAVIFEEVKKIVSDN